MPKNSDDFHIGFFVWHISKFTYIRPIIFNWSIVPLFHCSIVLLWKMIVSLKIVYQGHSIFEVHCLTNWSIVLLWKWYSATNWMLKFNLFLNSEIWYMPLIGLKKTYKKPKAYCKVSSGNTFAGTLP